MIILLQYYGFDPTSRVQSHTHTHTHTRIKTHTFSDIFADILLLKNNTDVSVVVDMLAETCPFPRFWLLLLMRDCRLNPGGGLR